MRRSISVPLGVVAAGAAGLAYAAGVEVNMYRLRRFSVPILAPEAQPLSILHLSDIHMVPGQRRKQAWLRSLADLRPDLVVNTGDNLSHPDAVPEVLSALEPLLELPGAFVLGSNDYFQAKRLNPTKYLRSGDRSHAPRRKRAENDWPALQTAFAKEGWLNLNNARAVLELPKQARTVGFVGVDDPHVRRDRYPQPGSPKDPQRQPHPHPHPESPNTQRRDPATSEVTLGVAHAPYLRVLDAMTAEGLPLIMAGHTHGGQLCIPFYGALVTNCDLDRARAKGLHTHTAQGNTSYLHVSAGCGASRYAPARFACPPEASLITLVPRTS
jgi:predicted MPP superfamily phosphohydrolase